VNYRLFLAISFVAVLVACTSEAQKAPTQEAPKTQASKLVQATVAQTAAVNCGDSPSQTAMNECFARSEARPVVAGRAAERISCQA
jgi:hypothetical protein